MSQSSLAGCRDGVTVGPLSYKATLRSLDRLRDALEQVPESAALSDPVVLRVQDAVLLARQLLSRLR